MKRSYGIFFVEKRFKLSYLRPCFKLLLYTDLKIVIGQMILKNDFVMLVYKSVYKIVPDSKNNRVSIITCNMIRQYTESLSLKYPMPNFVLD